MPGKTEWKKNDEGHKRTLCKSVWIFPVAIFFHILILHRFCFTTSFTVFIFLFLLLIHFINIKWKWIHSADGRGISFCPLFIFFFILSISIIIRFQSAVDVMIWSMYLSLMNHSLSQSGWNESSLWHLFATLYYVIAGSQMAILVIIQLLLVFSVLTSRAQIRKFYYL